MDICDIGVYDQFCYTGKTCKADKRQCLSTYYCYYMKVKYDQMVRSGKSLIRAHGRKSVKTPNQQRMSQNIAIVPNESN